MNMEQPKLSSHQLKRFVRHLCIVAKHYHGKENARKSLESQLKKIKKSTDSDINIELLNKKINMLLEKETKVAELGLTKSVPASVLKKIKFLEEQLKLDQEERNKLTSENEKLKNAIDSVSDLKGAVNEFAERKDVTEDRVKIIEKHVDKEYNEFLINEMEEKIALLESSYKRISRDMSIDPSRIHKIGEKLKSYKEQLKKLKKS